MWHGLALRTAYSYGEAKNTIDPGSTAVASWTSNATPGDPEQPRPRLLVARTPATASSCRRPTRSSTSSFGATSISAFWETRTLGNTSYIFAADANGDSAQSTT